MPKRGGNNGRGRNWNNGGGDGSSNYQSSYNGNRDRERERDRNHENVRRVSFKPNTSKIQKNKNRNWDSVLKNLDDDDIDMGTQGAGRGGGQPYFRGGFRGRGRRDGRVNSPAPRQNYQPRKLLPGLSPWYQVTIPFGQKHEKTFLLNALLSSITPDVFIPHFYTTVGNAAIFYVDDFGMAEKLQNLDRTISMPDGFRLGIRVKSGTPHINIDETLLEKMKLAMAGRYNAATKALDLTKFHSDPGLVDVFCALFRPSIMLAAINIISENIPDIVALNLNDNKIQTLDHFKSLLKKLPNLRILYLANNRIPHINSLESLAGFPFIEMYLEGNPLADRFKEKDVYVREVRKKFPKLAKLDGNPLPALIGFDVTEEEGCLPPSRASFLCSPDGQTMVRQFLEQYFALYDSDSRQPLLDAYHENAMLSTSAYYGYGQSKSIHQSNRLNNYISNSRNLLRILDRDYRRKLVKTGRLQVVAFLNDLPKTQHDPLSFCVDLTIFTPALIMLTVNGVFKEASSTSSSSGSNKQTSPPIRYFHKTMVIVPHGGGFCIKNDIIFITNPTIEQEKTCFKPPIVSNPAPPPAYPAASPLQPGPGAALVAPPAMDHQQLIQTLALQTTMNYQWSTNCLEQTNWDFQRAVLIFTELHKQGKIPPEAFVK